MGFNNIKNEYKGTAVQRLLRWVVCRMAIRWDDVLFDNVTKKEGRAT